MECEESESETVPHVQRASWLSVWPNGNAVAAVGPVQLHVAAQAALGSRVVCSAHVVGCRYSGLAVHHQNVLQAYILPLGAVALGLVEAVVCPRGAAGCQIYGRDLLGNREQHRRANKAQGNRKAVHDAAAGSLCHKTSNGSTLFLLS